jgi:Concanavalin A-like lectin/glucanases superfamily
MRCACLLWFIAGCGFSSPSGLADDPGGPSGPGDPGAPAGPGGGSGSASQCDASNPSPLLCVAFGGAPLVSDLATPAHELLEHVNILPLPSIALPVTGFVVHTAGTFGMDSKLRFKERPDLDVNDLTIDLWISPGGGLVSSDPSLLLDNNGEYSAAYNSDGTVRCGVAGTSLDSSAKVAVGTWHHVACTYGMADRTLKVYVDGDLSGCKMASAIPHGGKDGVAVGASYDPNPKPLQPNFQQHFAGSLGHLHIYGTELTADQICHAAGRSGCSQSCSGSDGGGSEGG